MTICTCWRPLVITVRGFNFFHCGLNFIIITQQKRRATMLGEEKITTSNHRIERADIYNERTDTCSYRHF